MSMFSRWFGKRPASPPAVPERLPASPARVPRDEGAIRAAAAAALAQRTAEEESLLVAAIADGGSDTLVRLALEGSTTAIRQRAAQAVDDPAQVRELIRRLRGGKDKSVYRILTAKRDAELAGRAAAERRAVERAAAAEAIERHSRRAYDPLFEATLAQFEARWQPFEGDAPAELAGRVREALERARDVIRQHRERIDTEAERTRSAAQAAAEARRRREIESAAAAVAAAEEAGRLEAERGEQRARREAEELALRAVGRLLRSAQAALEQGNTARAARLRAEIETQRSIVPALPPRLAKPLQQIDERLEELKDWRSFSVAPKREELLLEIESLIDSTLEPPVLAGQIRDLQQQWRTLHKGAGDDFAVERERFRALAQRAYEPCRLYFAAQAEVRAANLLRREELLERLAAFCARQTTDDPDWRLILQVLAEARREWRQYFPVERDAARPSQARFDALAGELQGRLNAEYARNVAARQALIERAAKLLELPDTRQAIDEVKELQRAWKTIGLVPRDEADTLWENFRLHCDGVFRRREEESAAYLAELEANRSKALALCEDVERIGGLSGAELLAGTRQLEELRSGFESLEFPRAGARELRNRFERAFERCLDALAAQRAHDAQRVWSDVFEVAGRIRALALATVRSADSETRGALRQQAQAALASVSEWPKGARTLLERGLEQATAGEVSADIAANELALRVLCVRAEILADCASPPEEETLRREQQMQRLLRSMGQGTARVADQLEELFVEWIVVGPTEDAAWARLLQRLTTVRACVASDTRSTDSPDRPTAPPHRRSSGEPSR